MSPIRIGTRDSQLAKWQANKVKSFLDARGIPNELIYVKTEGDVNLTDPLHQLGTVGIFTKALDDALLNGSIDLAVHSCKDYPTQPTRGLEIQCYLERASHRDLLVLNRATTEAELHRDQHTIATGSIRRKAQWLHKFPGHTVVNLRGNVTTRINKIETSNWTGGILAEAGLTRLEISPKYYQSLDWMIPAPAQGVVITVVRAREDKLNGLMKDLNDSNAHRSSVLEREFLRILEGGCSAPIGAIAYSEGGKIHFEGVLLDLEGKDCIRVKETASVNDWEKLGARFARQVLDRGGEAILEKIKLEDDRA